MKKGNRIIIIVVLLFFDFLLLKNPVMEYFKIKTGNNEDLTKMFISLNYAYDYWPKESITGENLKREDTMFQLSEGKLIVLNWPFSKTFKPLFHLSYSETNPYISVSFDLDNKETTYYYNKDNDLNGEYASIEDKEEKEFIEKTSHMSVEDIKKDVVRYREDFVKSLNIVKAKRLKKLFSRISFILISSGLLIFSILRLPKNRS